MSLRQAQRDARPRMPTTTAMCTTKPRAVGAD